jgi:hypothetical protein
MDCFMHIHNPTVPWYIARVRVRRIIHTPPLECGTGRCRYCIPRQSIDSLLDDSCYLAT